MNTDCPFCNLEHNKVILQNNTCIGFFDLSPVSPGHLLIIPRRHAETFFDLTQDERSDMLKLLDEGKQLLDLKENPDGYNIGWNCGTAAGQTVMHCHYHLIPQFEGDTPNPRGGVRGVIPRKQHYEFDDFEKPEMPANVRIAQMVDSPAINQLINGELGYHQDIDQTKEMLRKVLENKQEAVFVYQNSSQILGFIHVAMYHSLLIGSALNVMGVAVNSQYRRQGIGSHLFQAVENYAQAYKIELLRLNTGVERANAYAFYRSLGFEEDKKQLKLEKKLI